MGTPGTDFTTADTAPLPGMVYLRRPVGAPSPPTGTREPPAAPRADGVPQLLSGATASPDARSAVTAEIARLLTLWLEAYDGRRPVNALRRGPFSPGALDELRARIRSDLDRRSGAPARSRLLQVHLPPSHHRRLSFTASAAVDGRVRAVVGHLARYESRWRVESVNLM